MIDFDTLVTSPCMGIFGEPVRYSPAEGVAFDIVAVYDPAFLEQQGVESLMGSGVLNTRPVLGIQLSQFPAGSMFAPAQNDLVMIYRTGEIYQVSKLRPDGHGGARLDLNAFTPARLI